VTQPVEAQAYPEAGKPVHWRNRLCLGALLAMETLALFVLGSLLGSTGNRPGPSFLAILGSAIAGFALARQLARFAFSRRTLIVAGIFVSAAGLWVICSLQFAGVLFDPAPLLSLGSDPTRLLNGHSAQVLGIAVIGLAWVRGVLLATRSEITHRIVLASLTSGLGIVVIGLSFGRAAINSRAIDSAALPFFACGLMALALVQLSQSEHIQGDTWRGPWLLVLLATIGGLAVVGAIFGLLPLDSINNLLAPVGSLLLLAFDLLLYLLVLPIVIVFNWILVHLLGGRLHPLDFNLQTLQQAQRQGQHQGHASGLALLLINLAHLLLVLAIAAIVALVLLWVFRKLERAGDDELRDREPIEAQEALVSDLRSLLAGFRRYFRRADRPQEPPLSPRLLALRRIYLSLLHQAEERGIARPLAATPREHAPVLEQGLGSPFPLEASDRFARGRYGLVEPSDAELDRLQQGLREIH
jgi:hypothetical protein